jgi:hypothetical protein
MVVAEAGRAERSDAILSFSLGNFIQIQTDFKPYYDNVQEVRDWNSHAAHLSPGKIDLLVVCTLSLESAEGDMCNNKTIKPFARQGNYTVFDNSVLDYIMPQVSASAWKVLSFIIRKTIGWHRDDDYLSAGQIMAGTGINSDRTITEVCKELEQLGCIIVVRVPGKMNHFILNRDLEITVITPANFAEVDETPANFAGLPPQKLRTQNKDSKQIDNDDYVRVDNLGTLSNQPQNGTSPIQEK